MMFFKFRKKEEPEFRATPVEAIMISVHIDGTSYIMNEISEYKSRADLVIDVVSEKDDGGHDIRKEKVTVLRSCDERFSPFVLNGRNFLWDFTDHALRYRPEVDTSVRLEFNKWFHLVDDSVVWVERRYALDNLSEQCLGYAYDDGKGNFCWSKDDKSSHTVFMELYRAVMEYKNEDDFSEIGRAFLEVYNDGAVANNTYTDWFFGKYSVEVERRKGNYRIVARELDIKDFYYREYVEN